ncbi:FAD-dependent monooxygenase [Nocardia sp. CA2R105]|uniref:FAD-dependent oxidoreductase n=1 Tax=Nocardia coffeae TaxID=2873381 RepID=UPI001CA6F773|nr:FAD-dependent monooxygenase [Nocardia coffeae]MBY8863729.1 FAD-dependent monooxygenase [Nocardia coffeae]
MNTVPATAAVVVIGAGPAGMTAGIALADAGVDVVLLDRLPEGANTSRAAVVHARTLEVLDEFDVAAELNERGLVIDQFDLNDGSQRLATVRFDDLPTPFPYTLLISQATTEEVLLARLREAGGTVLRPYTVTAVAGDDTGVTVEFTDAAGDSGSIRADYVIGADGMHSVVREQAGIGFTGASYPESFALADVRMDWPDPRTEVALHLAPQGFTLVAPLPDEQDDRYRIVATIDDAPEHPDLAFMQAIIDDRRPGGKVREVLWSSRFRVHHRLADHYRAGRILLAGDAAHVHSPAGGQGMNTGIQDGALLGQLLARVLHGEPDTLLDRYEEIRRPVAQGVVTLTDRMTRMATLRPRPARALRNIVIRTATSFPSVRRAVAFRLAELTAR